MLRVDVDEILSYWWIFYGLSEHEVTILCVFDLDRFILNWLDIDISLTWFAEKRWNDNNKHHFKKWNDATNYTQQFHAKLNEISYTLTRYVESHPAQKTQFSSNLSFHYPQKRSKKIVVLGDSVQFPNGSLSLEPTLSINSSERPCKRNTQVFSSNWPGSQAESPCVAGGRGVNGS